VTIAGGAVLAIDVALENLIDENPLNETIEENAEIMQERLDIVLALTFMSGICLVFAGLLRLGFILRFVSEAYLSGILPAVSLTVIIQQIPSLLGINIESSTGLFQSIKSVIKCFQIIDETNIATLIVSLIVLIILIFVKSFINVKFAHRLPIPVPIDVIVLIIGTLISSLWKMDEKFDIEVVGNIPGELPTPAFPLNSRWTDYIGEGVRIAFMTFVGSPVILKSFAMKYNQPYKENQETFAMGMANIIGPVFGALALAVSAPRSYMMESNGGRTQLTHIIGAITTLIILVAAASLLEKLPSCIIAAIIAVSFINGVSHLKRLGKYWKSDKHDFVIMVASFLACFLSNISNGIMIGLGTSILMVALRTQQLELHTSNQGNYNNRKYFVSAMKYIRVSPVPNVEIVTIEGAIYFANSIKVKESLLAPVKHQSVQEEMPERNENGVSVATVQLNNGGHSSTIDDGSPSLLNEVHIIVADFSAVAFIDTAGMRMMMEVRKELEALHGVYLRIAKCTETALKRMRAMPTMYMSMENCIYPSIDDAVADKIDISLSYEQRKSVAYERRHTIHQIRSKSIALSAKVRLGRDRIMSSQHYDNLSFDIIESDEEEFLITGL